MENNSIPNSKITNDRLIRYKPISTIAVGHIQTYMGECVLTKEEFLLAYNTWIRDDKNEEVIKNDTAD
jgi:hypothetical protein